MDINDRSHLLQEIEKDKEFLTNKQGLILKKLRKTIGVKILKNNSGNHSKPIEYNTPDHKTKWHIFYQAYKNETVKEARFLSVHKYVQKNKTFYIVLDSRHTEEVVLQIFNSHFVKRLAKRSTSFSEGNMQEIAQFIFGEEFRYTTKWGLSLGTYYSGYKIFENKTFISKKELFEDQNEDLKKHFLEKIKLYDSRQYELLISSWADHLDPLEMASREMWNYEIGQKSNPGIDFLTMDIFKNFK